MCEEEFQNSHDLNTAYTCDQYQEVKFPVNVGFHILYENGPIQALMEHRS
ncbi:hypothetical protein T09_6743 [Trichinella sp. T9]|nr:hypothetical protein T09_6743 [Trichinella sp. T9]